MALATDRGPATSAHTADRNRCGRATAMTLATPIKPHRLWLLRLNFKATRRFPALLARLIKLSFIHYARWTIVDRLPYNGPPQREERLNYQYLFFLSNYNGYWLQYIDAFANILPDRMDKIWLNTYGYPKGAPAADLKRAIRKNEYVASHYYSAYPDASVTMILSALELKNRLDELRPRSDGDDEAFYRDYHDFLTAVQKHL